MKFTFNSFKYFVSLAKLAWKNNINKFLIGFIVIGGSLDLFTEKDLTGGIAFFGFILFAALLRIEYLKQQIQP